MLVHVGREMACRSSRCTSDSGNGHPAWGQETQPIRNSHPALHLHT